DWRDGTFPIEFGCGDRVARADDRPRVAHRGDVEQLRRVAVRPGPAGPDEIEPTAELEHGAVDRPRVVAVGDATLELPVSLRVVVERDQRIHAVVRVV